MDLSHIWGDVCFRIVLCPNLCARNQRAPHRRGGKDVGGQSFAVQILGERARHNEEEKR